MLDLSGSRCRRRARRISPLSVRQFSAALIVNSCLVDGERKTVTGALISRARAVSVSIARIGCRSVDAYLNVRGAPLRVTLKSLAGRRGLGVCGLSFQLELLPGGPTPSFSGTQMLIQGQLYVTPEGSGMFYVG